MPDASAPKPQLPDVRTPPDPWRPFAEYGLHATAILDWKDHGILRRIWSNFEEIAPGVFRSNQPSHRRFAALKRRGISQVLNLRGFAMSVPHLTAQSSCDALGIKVTPLGFSARSAPPREFVQEMIEVFRSIPHPFVMHCKSGADRTSFASAVYLNVITGEPMTQAKRMLSIRYVHLKFSKTGILDYILDSYIADNNRAEISFEDWIATHYDPETLQAAYNNRAPILS